MTEKITNSIGMTFVFIKPGTFIMGSPSGELERYDNETQHQVTLTRGFYMGETEVTVGQWRTFARDAGYRTEAETGSGAFVWTWKWEKKEGAYCDNPGFAQSENHPVTCVSWNDVQAFIRWINRKEGADYRLPTEAEWEYAARSGSESAFSGGGITKTDCAHDPVLDSLGWYCGNSGGKTHPVAQKNSNSWGLYDMHGNASEWCQDWEGDYPSGGRLTLPDLCRARTGCIGGATGTTLRGTAVQRIASPTPRSAVAANWAFAFTGLSNLFAFLPFYLLEAGS